MYSYVKESKNINILHNNQRTLKIVFQNTDLEKSLTVHFSSLKRIFLLF